MRPEEVADGERRLIVNLGTLEYLDPVRFGQAPTLAGMVSDVPKNRDLQLLKKAATGNGLIISIAVGLFVMLCHPERRGGGDIPANAAEMAGLRDARSARHIASLFKGCDDVKGRWRGGHILGTTEIRRPGWPTTEDVIACGTDISDRVIRYLVAVSHY